MSVLQGLALLVVCVLGTCVVAVREPKRQLVVFMIFGLALSVAFALLQAPDVALSEMAVGSVAVPFAILAALVRIEHGPKPK